MGHPVPYVTPKQNKMCECFPMRLISVSKLWDIKGVEVLAGKGLETDHEGGVDDHDDNQEDVDEDVPFQALLTSQTWQP